MNKRGDLSITLLVFMIFTLCLFSLVAMIYNLRTVDEKVVNPDFIGKVYLQEDRTRSLLDTILEKSAVEAYSSLAVESSGKDYKDFFKNANDLNLEARTRENFIMKFQGMKFQEDYMKKVAELTNFNLKIENGVIKADLGESYFHENATIEEIKGIKKVLGIVYKPGKYPQGTLMIDAGYKPEISSSFELDKLGLVSFDKLKSVIESCKKDANCLQNNLGNFDVVINANKVVLKTKKSFMIGTEFRVIEISMQVS